MKYLRLFEIFRQRGEFSDTYILDVEVDGTKRMTIDSINEYLGVSHAVMNEITCKYDIDVINFMKEIFVGKKVSFLSLNKIKGDPVIDAKIDDVDYYGYQDEIFIKFFHGYQARSPRECWYLVSNLRSISVYDYDAENKPLHKEVELKKEAEKYNL